MKKSRFSEQQIINILKQADAGVKVQDLCRQLASAMRPTISGSLNMVAWKPQILNGCERSRPKTPNSNACSLTWLLKIAPLRISSKKSSDIFESLEEVREVAWWWMLAYNEERPHNALGGLPTSIFRKRLSAETSTFGL